MVLLATFQAPFPPQNPSFSAHTQTRKLPLNGSVASVGSVPLKKMTLGEHNPVAPSRKLRFHQALSKPSVACISYWEDPSSLATEIWKLRSEWFQISFIYHAFEGPPMTRLVSSILWSSGCFWEWKQISKRTAPTLGSKNLEHGRINLFSAENLLRWS